MEDSARIKEDYKKYYEIQGKRIGKGSFGEVFKVKDKETNEIKALKIIEIDTDYNDEKEIEDGIKSIINELKGMKICSNEKRNKYSVRFYEYFRYENQFVIIMELCDNNLQKVWKDRNMAFEPEDIYKIMNQLNETFKIMVKNNIVHRDLKLENILIKYIDEGKKDFIVKLTDYGVSKQVTSTRLCQSQVGTDMTMAPEVLEGKDIYDNRCDLWSIGVIMYQLLYNEFPYKGKTQVALLNNINNLRLSALKQPDDDELKDLIFRLLARDPRERITWNDYFNHPFFTMKKKDKNSTTKISTNQIIIKIKVSDRNKQNKVYFLENNAAKIMDKEIEYFKELNNENTELYINGKKKDFQKYIDEESLKEGNEFTIKLILKNKITSCNSMFYGCFYIKSIDLSLFDSSEVNDMSLMFGKCFNLTELKLGNLDTEKVTSMKQMFQKCKSLEEINFPPSFTTKNVKDISLMFADCWSIKDLSLAFDTQNVENMKGLFLRCYNLLQLDLTSFKTDKVKKMTLMFDGCTRLEEIKFNPENFKTTSVVCMGHMFNNCQSLKLSKLNGFSTENVKFMNSMFANCEKFIDIDLSNLSNQSCDNITHMFDGCINLKKINLCNFADNNNCKINNMFDNCPLEEVKVKNDNIVNQFKKEFEKINFKI
jgi:surface protein